MLVKEKKAKIFLFELELFVEYQPQILISWRYAIANKSNNRGTHFCQHVLEAS